MLTCLWEPFLCGVELDSLWSLWLHSAASDFLVYWFALKRSVRNVCLSTPTLPTQVFIARSSQFIGDMNLHGVTVGEVFLNYIWLYKNTQLHIHYHCIQMGLGVWLWQVAQSPHSVKLCPKYVCLFSSVNLYAGKCCVFLGVWVWTTNAHNLSCWNLPAFNTCHLSVYWEEVRSE